MLMVKCKYCEKSVDDEEATMKHQQYFCDEVCCLEWTEKTLRDRELKEDEEERRKARSNFVLKINNYIDNTKLFIEKHPFFYDESNSFWLWNDEKYCYELTDEIDLMNLIERALSFGGETINSTIKNSYMEAFKRVGRERHPKEAPSKWIQFKDKAISLTSGKVHNITPDYFFCNPIPFDLGKSNQTPTMDKLFKEWVGEERIKTLYEVIAYCCFREYPIHLAFCFIGSGRNGKSQFQRIVETFLGSGNITSTELELLSTGRFESFKMYKKLACMMGETNVGVFNKSAMFKKLTGGDTIGYERKGKDPFDGISYAKILINSNSMPISTDTSEGFYRRWFIVDFPNNFPEGKDIINTIPAVEYNNLARKISLILPGLIEEGKFSQQGDIEQRKEDYIRASNPVTYFLDSCCTRDPTLFVSAGELYVAYTRYLLLNKKRRVNRREFLQVLGEEGFFQNRTSKPTQEGLMESNNYIEGIFLNLDWEKCCIVDKEKE